GRRSWRLPSRCAHSSGVESPDGGERGTGGDREASSVDTIDHEVRPAIERDAERADDHEQRAHAASEHRGMLIEIDAGVAVQIDHEARSRGTGFVREAGGDEAGMAAVEAAPRDDSTKPTVRLDV